MGSQEFTLRLAHAKLRAEQKVKAFANEATAAKPDPQQMTPDDDM